MRSRSVRPEDTERCSFPAPSTCAVAVNWTRFRAEITMKRTMEQASTLLLALLLSAVSAAQSNDPGGGNGILSTAGGLVFTNESGHLVALDAASGKVLWHVNPGGNLTGSPMSYEIDGRQFVLTPVDGVLYAWALPT